MPNRIVDRKLRRIIAATWGRRSPGSDAHAEDGSADPHGRNPESRAIIANLRQPVSAFSTCGNFCCDGLSPEQESVGPPIQLRVRRRVTICVGAAEVWAAFLERCQKTIEHDLHFVFPNLPKHRE